MSFYKSKRGGLHIFCSGSSATSKLKIGRNYLFYILQAYLVAFYLKCKMAFHLECMSCQLSRVYVPVRFHFATAKDPCNYEVNDGVPDSIKMATAKAGPNEEVESSDNSGEPYQCNTMPSSSDDIEDETESITYLKRNPYPSLNYSEGVAFHKSEKALSNALIRAEN
jgi:hypothetical protein